MLEHARVWEEMVASGCLFVVCALESVNDEILVRLEKGHTTVGERKPEVRLGGGCATRPRAPRSNPLRAQICGAQA